jgi:hypothetical protein
MLYLLVFVVLFKLDAFKALTCTHSVELSSSQAFCQQCPIPPHLIEVLVRAPLS